MDAVAGTAARRSVESLVTPARDRQLIYAGTASGLAKSTDGGATWTVQGLQGVPVIALAVAPTDSNRVMVVSEGGDVYRSDDGGIAWRLPA